MPPRRRVKNREEDGGSEAQGQEKRPEVTYPTTLRKFLRQTGPHPFLSTPWLLQKRIKHSWLDGLMSTVGCPRPAPRKVAVYDLVSVKRCLDEVAYEVMEVLGFKPNKTMENVRLTIMAAACIVGLIGQFTPGFPGNTHIIIPAVIAYFVLSAFLYVFAWFIEKDYIFLSKDGERSLPPDAHLHPGLYDGSLKSLRKASQFAKRSENEKKRGKSFCKRKLNAGEKESVEHQLKVWESVDRMVWPSLSLRSGFDNAEPSTYILHLDGGSSGKNLAELVVNYGLYFTEEGYFACTLFEADLIDLITRAAGELEKK